jgi:isoleucyl-tRNA synthetase
MDSSRATPPQPGTTAEIAAATAAVTSLLASGGKFSFPGMEEKIMTLWGDLDAFKTSLKLSEGRPAYTFYDGPPFATGLPHYGHILAGTIKDTVTRYAHQTGHYVSRRFGWDCHGLPVEHEIDKKLEIKGAQDVADMGIDVYNAECRAIVTRYTSEWENVVTRLGRWIDFKNDYKTMEPWYMESVWWVFSELFKKGLVYSSYKVMPYSTACTTPLSNFEAKLAYKDVDDPAVVVSFPIVGDESTSLLAWTTTPWTLPSNLALCVHAQMHYVKIQKKSTGELFIMADARLGQLFAPCAQWLAAKQRAEEAAGGAEKKAAEAAAAAAAEKSGFARVVERTFEIIFTDEVLAGIAAEGQELDFAVLERMVGADLVGKQYVPLFTYFVERCPNAFRVVADEYVTDNGGTGIVHQAPAFGEDDFRVCIANAIVGDPSAGELELPCPIDADGRFTAEVPEFVGQHVKEADSDICRNLKDRKRLIQKATYHHSYPFCWRSDTPLIYRAIPSWFVKVTAIKEKIIANNKTTHWVPTHVKEGRFHNWLVEAHDWAISRNRYWGTPLPIWTSDDREEIVVPESIAHLEELTGQAAGSITDLHRESIDGLTIPSKQGKGVLKRVPEVFDCWFESGSMPYAQSHYPFENKEQFEANFPADFIAEGLDQTRGWFYTLMVISTALFDKPPFKNLICNGLVLAEDGKKMSKRLKNYPDPSIVTNKYGADALRLYLINSPVVRAEPFAFAEAGVKRVVQTVMLPWLNTLVLFNQSVVRMTAQSGIAFAPDRARVASSSNAMDRWVMATLQQLIAKVRAEMAAYNLFNVVPPLVDFIGSLTNWYLRLNRFRLKGKGAGGAEEQLTALCTLYDVLLDLSVLMGPATPFFAEFVYQSMRLHHPLYAADAAAASAADGVAVDALGRSESVRVAVVSILLFALFFCCSPILLFALYSFVCSLYSRCTTS